MNDPYLEILDKLDSNKGVIENCEFLYDYYRKKAILDHVRRVAEKAIKILGSNDLYANDLEAAAYLHDISGIIDQSLYESISEKEKIDICDEEKQYPLLMHQKISMDIAAKCFNIKSIKILSAIGCHTTLKANATLFDMVIFIADKLEWDQKDKPGYYDIVESALENSIEKAVECFLDYKMKNKNQMLIVHPWMNDAYSEICVKRNRRTTAST